MTKTETFKICDKCQSRDNVLTCYLTFISKDLCSKCFSELNSLLWAIYQVKLTPKSTINVCYTGDKKYDTNQS